ncbi:hypothetical protein BOTBODRAFT_27306 [Botryobasidium botryosum FD-172 SS1]|uniref:F-box domain-containing protein n=1 Tax=Botryobasidium botryosum (strain FD-172 SS1) TaxID=930990 RepID=A0A067MWB6_BOTB1|nr:hypothetical protein BOTBODRAFT_27306 [Botryobasidium botryosum FD-172 SS1]
MRSLSTLDYDTLSTIFLYLRPCSSLLSLALTCHAMHEMIVPKFLFASVSFNKNIPDERLASFCRAILTYDRAIGDAVRHFTIPYGHDSCPWGDVLQKMSQLRSLDSLGSLEDSSGIPEGISAQVHLTSLTLGFCPQGNTLEFLRGLGPLQTLVMHRMSRYDLSPESAVASLLYTSRHTLAELRLDFFTWNLRIHPASGNGDLDFVWPSVHTLQLDIARVKRPFDPAHFFPATRNLILQLQPPPHLILQWTTLPCVDPFFSRLESIECTSEQLEFAVGAGAQLHRISVVYGVTSTEHDLPWALPGLRSFSVRMRFYSPNIFTRLCNTALSLTSLNVKTPLLYGLEGYATFLEDIITRISPLPLKYFQLHISSDDLNEGHDHAGMFIERASRSIPTLRAATLAWPTSAVYWQKAFDQTEAGSHFRVVSREDGENLKGFYDWNWD